MPSASILFISLQSIDNTIFYLKMKPQRAYIFLQNFVPGPLDAKMAKVELIVILDMILIPLLYQEKLAIEGETLFVRTSGDQAVEE